ncbi:hypothetical protein O181_089944 [Austropuccinia psidii MF-1]|uniref:Uncharacterized protein n=1 Tax=Austropuccinia psidii MF-1 TaxID=1389203 RepID=A0A9Q3IUH6_9BASI|nr:hypothetical protein [Austropuccinia psidii MF-1]
MVICTHSIPSREYWQFILKGHARGSLKHFVKGQCSINPPWQPQLFKYSPDSPRPVFNHTSWENHSTQFISQSGKVYTPLDNHKASSIQHRTTVSLKESSSQRFTFTSLL